MPEGDEVNDVRQAFFDMARFSKCIGAIDCTHVKLQSPGGDTVGDPSLRIRDIVVRWPGSAHDSHIFRNSNLYANFKTGRFGDSLLVGDNGYPIKPYLITPLRNVRNEAEALLFNESQIRTRNVVERSYGVSKRRFPALAMGMRVHLDTAQAITVATAILHNIACNENEQVPSCKYLHTDIII
ncbi:hypothetical protein NQ317_005242 [Molorchus minor]|uniref:DDE Tnp4 domain-containing protein n=1 Tax=Molorchus minor TaxID=1323400 RepID=A0ABQ9JGS0_9CUCU|nr:hypothetical protein NQ317_005242 [Molorchus minor]